MTKLRPGVCQSDSALPTTTLLKDFTDKGESGNVSGKGAVKKAIRAAAILRTFLIGLLGMAGCVPTLADVPDRTISQFQHTAWTAREGAPTAIVAIAQTADGYLWLGSLSGLFRFDGVRFEQYQPRSGGNFPSNEIASLLALPDGSLWIGFRRSGASLLVKDHLTNYGERDGLPSGRLAGFAQDQAGSLWAAVNGGGLARFEDRRWKQIGADWKFPGQSAQTVFVDRQGTLWVATADTVVFLPRGAKIFQPTGEHIEVVCQMAEAPDGRIWLAETSRHVRPLRFPDRRASVPEIRAGSQAILFDETGALWATSVGDGIVWMSHPEKLRPELIRQNNEAVEMFTQKNGLTDNFVISIFEDRERNVWVGTPRGLERFRKGNLVPVAFPPGYQGFALAAGDNGTVWAGSLSRPITLLQNTKVTVGAYGYVGSVYRDPEGEVWLGRIGEVYRVRGEKITAFRSVFSTEDPSATVTAITRDRVSRLWVAMRGRGIWTLERNQWQRYENAALPSAPVWAEYTDGQGRLWFGYGSNLVVVLENDRVQTFSQHEGVTVGGVKVIRGRGDNVWIGGEFGLEVLKQGRFHMLEADGPKPFSGVSGIVETADGSLWLSESRGVIHILPTEVGKALRDSSHRAQYQLLDFGDGLPGTIQQVSPPTAIEGTDGRLWFATVAGLVWVNPAHMIRNDRPPNVLIRSVNTSGKEYPPDPALRLPIRTTNIRIDYTALSLSVPERVRFRYRLDAVDRDWQDVGTRREAFFDNLSAGHYRFQVTACNNDGVWNESGATMEFSILPTFYQTNWFLALCVAVFLTLLWGLHRLRLYQQAHQFHMLLEERVNERTRIARELHDSLLQGFQGLMFRLQAVRDMLPGRAPLEAIEALDIALERGDKAIAEGRDTVADLRQSLVGDSDIAEALKALSAELIAQTGKGAAPCVRVLVEGKQRQLTPILCVEVYRIGCEALRNAFHHSKAQKVEAEITYGDSEFLLHVRDDGIGIAPEVVNRGTRAGHWGLPGMRERAKSFGGKLEVWSEHGAGTEIELIVPATIAYGKPGVRSRFWFWREKIEGTNGQQS